MLTKVEPKVSVIIPVYNVEKYLRKCLDSLINQTFADIEIICIDDGSTDNSLQILNEYSKKDDRIIVLTQKNQGPGVARNKGLEIAKGEYLSFVDPDDWISLNFYENLYSEAIVGEYDVVKGRKIFVPEPGVYQKEKIKNFKVKNHNVINKKAVSDSYWSCIYKKKIVKKFNIKFAPTYRTEDVAFYRKFLCVAKTYSSSVYSEYYVFNRPGSLTKLPTSISRKIDSMNARLDMFNFINGLNLSKEEYLENINVLLEGIVSYIGTIYKDGFGNQIEEFYKYIDVIDEYLKFKEAFENNENYQFLISKNFSVEIFEKRGIAKKFKNLNLIKKLFYIGNFRQYKLLSILGLRFSFKRF